MAKKTYVLKGRNAALFAARDKATSEGYQGKDFVLGWYKEKHSRSRGFYVLGLVNDLGGELVVAVRLNRSNSWNVKGVKILSVSGPVRPIKGHHFDQVVTGWGVCFAGTGRGVGLLGVYDARSQEWVGAPYGVQGEDCLSVVREISEPGVGSWPTVEKYLRRPKFIPRIRNSGYCWGAHDGDGVSTLCLSGMVTGVVGYSTYSDGLGLPRFSEGYLDAYPYEPYLDDEGMPRGYAKKLPVLGYSFDECSVLVWTGHAEIRHGVSGTVDSYVVVGSKKGEAIKKAESLMASLRQEIEMKRVQLLSGSGIDVPQDVAILWDDRNPLHVEGYEVGSPAVRDGRLSQFRSAPIERMFEFKHFMAIEALRENQTPKAFSAAWRKALEKDLAFSYEKFEGVTLTLSVGGTEVVITISRLLPGDMSVSRFSSLVCISESWEGELVFPACVIKPYLMS